MDNLTHTAIGLFLSRIGLGRWSPRGTAIVVIAANIPDIDVVSAAGGTAEPIWHTTVISRIRCS